MRKINPFEVVYEQYRKLGTMLESTLDIEERNRLFRRMINLLNVMEFLIAQAEPST